MITPPDDRSLRREMAIAYRSGWHTVDLVTAIPNPGDSLMVTLFGEPIVVARDDEDDIRAYRCLRRPRGAPQPVRTVVRYGMIFVNLDQRDHQLVGETEDGAEDTAPHSTTATPRSA
jgi:phenylpropionate dioxygenase-like ring-hydroxylating dioxygenase large terminal subunit